MSEFLEYSLLGILSGGVTALVALSFVLIYKGTGVVNFAVGEVMMLGAYIYYAGAVTFGLAPWLAFVVALGVLGALAVVVERLAEWGTRWLKAHCPVAPRVAIVHGDYRTGNFLEKGGRITAILDWELVHLGDPHEDLGWASLPMYMGGSRLISRLAEPEWFYRRYGEQAGIAVSMDSVRYYQAFSLLKLAATHMAAARCFEEGRFNDMRMPAMGSQIATCLKQMEKTIDAVEAAKTASGGQPP